MTRDQLSYRKQVLGESDLMRELALLGLLFWRPRSDRWQRMCGGIGAVGERPRSSSLKLEMNLACRAFQFDIAGMRPTLAWELALTDQSTWQVLGSVLHRGARSRLAGA